MRIGAYHLIDITLNRLNFASNMALKGHFWGEKYLFKARKARLTISGTLTKNGLKKFQEDLEKERNGTL